MIAELHEMGLQRLRAITAISPSGLHWRCTLVPAGALREDGHATLPDISYDLPTYSSAQEWDLFGLKDAEHLTVNDLALAFVRHHPMIARVAHGNDSEYAAWFREMMKLTVPDGLFYMAADREMPSDHLPVTGGAKAKGGEPIRLSFPPPPPPEIKHDPHPTPYPYAYWVVPGRFLAGYHPGHPDEFFLEMQMRALIACGIRLVVDLTEEHESEFYPEICVPYATTILETARELGKELECSSHPIPDMGISSRAEMRRILDEIDAELERGGGVYVHCLAGVGRTGTVVGCWLARHGIATGEDVLNRIIQLRAGCAYARHPSPQSDRQCEMVTGWGRGE